MLAILREIKLTIHTQSICSSLSSAVSFDGPQKKRRENFFNRQEYRLRNKQSTSCVRDRTIVSPTTGMPFWNIVRGILTVLIKIWIY